MTLATTHLRSSELTQGQLDTTPQFGTHELEAIVQWNLNDWTDCRSPHGGRRLTLELDGSEIGLTELSTWEQYAFGMDRLRVDPVGITTLINDGAVVTVNHLEEVFDLAAASEHLPSVSGHPGTPMIGRASGSWQARDYERTLLPGALIVQTCGSQQLRFHDDSEPLTLNEGEFVASPTGRQVIFSGPLDETPSMHFSLRTAFPTFADFLPTLRQRLQAHPVMRSHLAAPGSVDFDAQVELVKKVVHREITGDAIDDFVKAWTSVNAVDGLLGLERSPTRQVLPLNDAATVRITRSYDWARRGERDLVSAWLPHFTAGEVDALFDALQNERSIAELLARTDRPALVCDGLITLVLAGRVEVVQSESL